jgi:hypothetical protein
VHVVGVYFNLEDFHLSEVPHPYVSVRLNSTSDSKTDEITRKKLKPGDLRVQGTMGTVDFNSSLMFTFPDSSTNSLSLVVKTKQGFLGKQVVFGGATVSLVQLAQARTRLGNGAAATPEETLVLKDECGRNTKHFLRVKLEIAPLLNASGAEESGEPGQYLDLHVGPRVDFSSVLSNDVRLVAKVPRRKYETLVKVMQTSVTSPEYDTSLEEPDARCVCDEPCGCAVQCVQRSVSSVAKNGVICTYPFSPT